MLLLNANDPCRENSYWRGSDLVIEVVSEDSPERDTIVKRADYAEGRIPEYWIVNSGDETVTMLSLTVEGGGTLNTVCSGEAKRLVLCNNSLVGASKATPHSCRRGNSRG